MKIDEINFNRLMQILMQQVNLTHELIRFYIEDEPETLREQVLSIIKEQTGEQDET